jgi:hypothetical protein
MSPNDWDDYGSDSSTGSGTGGPEGDSYEDPFAPPSDDSPESEEEWLDELMEAVNDELSDLAALRRTSESMLEGEIDEDLWLTLEFQISDLPGPGTTEAIMTYTIEGNGEEQTGQVEFALDDPIIYAREDAREQIEEAIELHPTGG